MITFIKNRIHDSRVARAVVQYDRGYEFASGMLIRSLGTADPRNHIAGDFTSFDEGIMDATSHFQTMTRMVVGSK